MTKKTFLCIVAVCALFILGNVMVMAEESEIPDIVGTWKGESIALTDDLGKNLVSRSDKDNTAPVYLTFTLSIDIQDGRTFSGTLSSKLKSETIIGVIGYDNESLYMVDEGGTFLPGCSRKIRWK